MVFLGAVSTGDGLSPLSQSVFSLAIICEGFLLPIEFKVDGFVCLFV